MSSHSIHRPKDQRQTPDQEDIPMPQPQHSAKEKLHTACDECRTRKLKCSGEKPVCARCGREGVGCVYSVRKTMGRPRKRRREVEGEVEEGVEALAMQGEVSGFGTGEIADLTGVNGGFAADLGLGLGDVYDASTLSLDFTHTPQIDPLLWDTQAATQYQLPTPPDALATAPDLFPCPCSCLSLTYLTLTTLQTTPLTFPHVTIPLRTAKSTLSTLIHCPTCPRTAYTAIQNVSSLSSLFKALLERLCKILVQVDVETAQLVQSGGKKAFRIGDNEPQNAHLHTGTLDCPMGFDVDLEPGVWRALVKIALKKEVFGGRDGGVSLSGLLEEAEARQRRWHSDEGFLGEERGRVGLGRGEGEAERTCESLGAEHIRRAMGMLDWS